MIADRIEALRELMQKNKIDAYLIPSTDAHQSEYLPDVWQRRKWISGFDGSAGDVVVTMEQAGLWTDSRYFLQAEEQLNSSGIDLFKIGYPEVPDITEFLKENLAGKKVVGADPRLLSFTEARKIENALGAKQIAVKYLEENLVDTLWIEQPELPDDPVFVWEDKYSGEKVESKLRRIRGQMEKHDVTAHVLTTFDSIAWVFNLRGGDISFNPVFIGYAIITMDSALLFFKKKKNNRSVKKHLKGLVKFYDYDDFKKQLTKFAKRKNKIWLDGDTINRWIVKLLERKCHVFFEQSPVTLFKAQKNVVEIEGFKACHIRDGAAMVHFLHWLENEVPTGQVTEISASQKLEEFRQKQKMYKGPSFETISAYNEHGAIVHYSSSPDTDVELKTEGIYLVDSGGQYLDGTTDITRTIALGKPTTEQKDRFTRVLKGHISLAMTSFPKGTQGIQLDTLARQYLWDVGLNYGHGTGHGVGAFLNVHEGPQGISYYRGIGVPLEIGMICSNEPGFYKAGEYGIRIETLINVVKDEKKSSEEFEFYKFETATLCPIDMKLVDLDMLTEDEKSYLNNYHQRVYEKLIPLIKDEKVQNWLGKATEAI